jgi:hypothetical protein
MRKSMEGQIVSDFTDEDVQRGAEAYAGWLEHGAPHASAEWEEAVAVAVLTAVLPAYTARVRADALREAADAYEREGNYDYYSREQTRNWLRARADAEENR